MSHNTRSSSEQKRKRRKSDQSRATERFCLIGYNFKTVTVNQPTTDSTIVLKTGYRQTDKIHIYRLTDPSLLV